jgi:hypothetical protein
LADQQDGNPTSSVLHSGCAVQTAAFHPSSSCDNISGTRKDELSPIEIELQDVNDDDVAKDVPVWMSGKTQDMSEFAVNFKFVTRAWKILALGLQNPIKAPKLWAMVVACIISQIAGAWVIQKLLYILVTGKDSKYPGIAGCLKSGCFQTKLAPPGNIEHVQGYMYDFAW